ncbi:serine/threonine-protein kinase [Streptomyces sp. NPDC047000]|uniref:serine/threonine-protein kinase n=1 Tax=Streptomyces sp. NPDC047000 TaxID=3155474 RepID=UPI0033FA812D
MSEAERAGTPRRDESERLLAGRYRLGAVLGRGGMGTVWRAEDETLGRTVAVKELRFPSNIDEDEKRRLITRTLREAKAIARIRNNSAVTVFDVVDEDDRPWIVMELIEGKSLAEVIREDGLLKPVRAAEVGLAILDVLRSAHLEGILHRDVKPSNVLIASEDGRVVLTDFGIAQVEGDPSITSTGMLVGAPSYISPERARGHKPGPAADLWSLGGLLYAAVEGVPPYDKGSAIATLTAVMTEPLEEPRNAGPLRDVIFGLLTKDPAKRLDDAGARAMLTKVLDDADPKAEREPLDATKLVPLPPQPEGRADKGGPGGSGGKRGEEAAEKLRGALRSVRKAAVAAGSAATKAGGGGTAGGNAAGGATGTAASGATGAGAVPGARPPVSGPAAPGAPARGAAARSTSAAVSAAAGSSGTRASASLPSASGPSASGPSDSGPSASRLSGSGPAESRPTGSRPAVPASGAAGAGTAAASGADQTRAGGTQGANASVGGRSSGWPVMAPPEDLPDLPPRPARTVPRAPITDVVPRRTLVIVAVVVVLAVVGTVLAITLSGGGSGTNGKTGSGSKAGVSASASTSAGSGGGSATKEDKSGDGTVTDGSASGSGTGSATAPGGGGSASASGGSGSGNSGSGGSGSGTGAAVTTYRSAQGFSIGLPSGWKYTTTDSAGARFTGPEGQKLLVAWTSKPQNDPVADWRNQERYMTRSQYSRIRIAAVDYRGWNAADWEFTHVDGGVKYRTIDRGFVVNDHLGHALMYTAKAANWDSALRKNTWKTLTTTFEPKA